MNVPLAGVPTEETPPQSTQTTPLFDASAQQPENVQAEPETPSLQQSSPPPPPPPKASLGSLPFMRYLPIIGVIVVVLLVGFFAFRFIASRFTNQTPSGPVTLTYWGLWEDENTMRSVLDDFERQNPNIKVKYQKQSITQYRETLSNRLTQGTGPDIYTFHNTWTPMFKDVLAPVPQTTYTTSDYEKTFYPTTKRDLKVGNNYVGIPLEIDTLALFINTDMFQAAGLQTPKTWLDVRTAAKALTVTDKATGQIQTAGAALGTYDNVDGAADIVALMMLQNNVNFLQVNNSMGADGRNLGEDVLSFYTQFATDQRVWNNDLDPSTLAFAKGRVGMYLGYSWRIFAIKAVNPALKFTIVPVPQVSETTPKRLTYASYWAEGVSKKSPYQAQAFTLLKYLSSASVEQKLFAEDAKIRGFGMPYSRVDLAPQGKQNEFVAPFLELAPNAQSWYFASDTGDSDSGLVGGLTNYLAAAIRDTSAGKLSPKSALDGLAKGIAQKLNDYKITQ